MSAGSAPASPTRSPQRLWRELEPLSAPTRLSRHSCRARPAHGVRWVEPKLVAEVELRGWTADGLLRHASFKGLRDDKEPTEVVREKRRPRPPAQLRARCRRVPAHPSRTGCCWPDVGLTKQGLAEFYAEIADWILPHVVGRPLALVRCPSGSGKSASSRSTPGTG